MKKSLKIFGVILLAMLVVFSTTNFSYATNGNNSTAAGIIQGITADPSSIDASGMQSIAGKVLGLLQIVSAILAVILVAYLGFKMVLGAANEKADVQKQFIPLIIGVTIVFAATSIAKLLLGIMNAG